MNNGKPSIYFSPTMKSPAGSALFAKLEEPDVFKGGEPTWKITVVFDPKRQPVTVALNNLNGTNSVDWTVVMAAAVLAAAPTAIVYIVLGRFFIRGLLAGSMKG